MWWNSIVWVAFEFGWQTNAWVGAGVGWSGLTQFKHQFKVHSCKLVKLGSASGASSWPTVRLAVCVAVAQATNLWVCSAEDLPLLLNSSGRMKRGRDTFDDYVGNDDDDEGARRPPHAHTLGFQAGNYLDTHVIAVHTWDFEAADALWQQVGDRVVPQLVNGYLLSAQVGDHLARAVVHGEGPTSHRVVNRVMCSCENWAQMWCPHVYCLLAAAVTRQGGVAEVPTDVACMADPNLSQLLWECASSLGASTAGVLVADRGPGVSRIPHHHCVHWVDRIYGTVGREYLRCIGYYAASCPPVEVPPGVREDALGPLANVLDVLLERSMRFWNNGEQFCAMELLEKVTEPVCQIFETEGELVENISLTKLTPAHLPVLQKLAECWNHYVRNADFPPHCFKQSLQKCEAMVKGLGVTCASVALEILERRVNWQREFL